MELTDDALDLAVWRYGIISQLLHYEPEQGTKGSRLEKMGRQTYVRDSGEIVTVSPETIRKWLARYRQGGRQGPVRQGNTCHPGVAHHGHEEDQGRASPMDPGPCV